MTAIEFNHQLISHQNILKYFALKLTTDVDDAEDLLQETFLKALRFKDKFHESTNLKSWLFTIMKNTFINNYRRSVRKRNIISSSDDKEYLIPALNTSEVSPESQYNYIEITKTINMLNDDYRVPFILHNKGYKYKEIADKLGLPLGTVKSRIFLARKKLAKTLKDFSI